MGLLIIIIALIVILIVLELFKHQFTKSLMKYLIIIIILIFILLVASAYVDFGDFLGEGTTFSNTGAAIAEGVSDDVEEIDITESETLQTISEKTKEFLKKIIE